MSTAASSTTEPTHAEQEAQHGHAGTPGSYSDRQLGFWLVGAGLIALISSAILVYERLQIYIDAGHSTVCDINALLSCGTVMRTPQAEAFGFPNPFIGLVGFSIVVTIGAAMMAGAQFKKWFWVCMNIGLAAATAFIMWLWYQTTFQINALCLFCMIVWIMTITLFVKTTVRNVSAGVIPAAQSMRESARGWSWFAISLWLILIFGIIVIRFFEVIVNMMR
ncbi:vitamin K epoxide reductase family protein [uncultured Rothia sp.]|uniref:vitamin K epoxide reductase family protein n=1 Tax=uncultured Rothia sp. TaxID=316088 RepID=UPI00288AF72F|nr:vitamin K epoxide reductase family protein [uncultured Rothia sp.]